MTIKINNGSKLNNLIGKLNSITIYSDGNECINFWIRDENKNESLTYLSIKEAIELKRALQESIRESTL